MSEKNNRVSQYGVEEMFLDRWSSRSFSPKKIDQEQIDQLFEAAHWAPSSGNRQPWRFVYAKDGENRKNSTVSSMIVMRCGPQRLRC